MNEHEIEKRPDDLSFALGLAESAARMIHDDVQAGFTTEWKEDNTPVTQIDRDVNHYAIEKIKERFPDDRIFGEEESAEGGSGYTWIVDPIDGSQAMDLGLPAFTFCIARTDIEGQPMFGIVCNPTTDEIYIGERGKPTLCNGKQLAVSTSETLKSSYIFIGSRMPETSSSNGQIYERLEEKGAKVLNTRALAFQCTLVANGRASGAYIGVKTPFEAAAVKLIVEGAGGKVTDLAGRTDFRYDNDINGLIVSNGILHDELTQIVQK